MQFLHPRKMANAIKLRAKSTPHPPRKERASASPTRGEAKSRGFDSSQISLNLIAVRKMASVMATATLLSFASISTLYADDPNSGLLKQIVANTTSLLPDPTQPTTTNLLAELDTIPTVLAQLGTFILAWTAEDKSPTTANLQGSFTQLGNLINQDMTSAMAKQPQLNIDLFSGQASPTLTPYANDLTYSTLLGTPFFAKDPRNKTGQPVDAAYNYIKNASAINLVHEMPPADLSSWNGTMPSKVLYQHYFNTVSAAESYNGYVLSGLYADGNQLNTLQQTLVSQASDPANWFAQVAAENIGIVLRQLLLYQSQIFILLTQMVQTEKQIAAASVMTNSLLIATQQINEKLLLSSAQGIKPSM